MALSRAVRDPVKARFMSQFYDLASVHDYQRQGASLVLTQHLQAMYRGSG